MPRAKTPRTIKPKAEKKVLQMPEAGNGSSNGSGLGETTALDLQAEIRVRAYELYQERGYVNGQAEQDWIAAEREVLSRHAQKHSA